MGREHVRTLLLITMAVLLISSPALAGSSYSNMKGFFCADWKNTDQNPEAHGRIIVNYDKSEGQWILHGRVWDTVPRDYMLGVGVAGVSNTMIGSFTVDETGRGWFRFTATNLPAEIDMIRIYELDGEYGWPDMGAKIDSPWAPLEIRGSKRGS